MSFVYRINTEYGIYTIDTLKSSIGGNPLSMTLHFPSKQKKDKNKNALFGFISIDNDNEIRLFSAQTFKYHMDAIICKNLMELYVHLADNHVLIDMNALNTFIEIAKRNNFKILE